MNIDKEAFISIIKNSSLSRFTCEQIRDIYESEGHPIPLDPREYGGAIKSAQSQRLIKSVEIRKSPRASRNGGYNTVWERIN